MKMRIAVVLSALLTLATSGFANQFIRFNHAGFFPTSTKEVIIISDEDVVGKKWTVTKDGDKEVLSGALSQSISGLSEWSPKPYNYKFDISSVKEIGNYKISLDGSVTDSFTISETPYNDLITSSIRWLRVMRSGSNETLDREPAHFGDSACFVYNHKSETPSDPWVEDENGRVADLQGGWYCGTDYSKFTSLIAYTTYYLLKSYNTNPEIFTKVNSKSDLVDVLDEAKFGLAYLMKVMPNDSDFYLQIGGYDNEHGVRLPKNDKMEGKRAVYDKLSTPQMATTVAALALGSSVFAKLGDATNAEAYKKMAIKIYDSYSKNNYPPMWLEKDYDLFKDETVYDNRLVASANLYNLTKDSKYFDDAKKMAQKAKTADWAGWNFMNMEGHSLIGKDYKPSLDYLKGDLNEFKQNSEKTGNIWGMPQEWTFSGVYNSLEIASGALNYYSISNDKKYMPMVQKIIDYSFGLNSWGVAFSANKRVKNSVKNFNTPIYKLQLRYYPEGAVALGPCDAEGHDEESKWILDDVRANYCYPFNTKESRFFDHFDDYMTMDAWISGVADNIYMLTLATKLMAK